MGVLEIKPPPVVKGLIKIYLTLYITVISLRFKLHSFFIFLYRCSLDFSVLHFLHGEKVISNKMDLRKLKSVPTFFATFLSFYVSMGAYVSVKGKKTRLK